MSAGKPGRVARDTTLSHPFPCSKLNSEQNWNFTQCAVTWGLLSPGRVATGRFCTGIPGGVGTLMAVGTNEIYRVVQHVHASEAGRFKFGAGW